MQTVEGYVEKGMFYPLGQIFNLSERRRAFVTVIDEPINSELKDWELAKAIKELRKELEDAPSLPAEFDEIINGRVNIARGLDL